LPESAFGDYVRTMWDEEGDLFPERTDDPVRFQKA